MSRGFLAIDRAALALCDSEPEVVCLMLMARRQDSRWSESNRTPDVEVGRSYWCERTGLSEWDLRRFVDRLVAAGRAVVTHPGDRRTVKRIRLVVDIAEARVTTDPRTDLPPTHGQPPTPDNVQIHRPSTDPRTDLPPQGLTSTIVDSNEEHLHGEGEPEGASLTTPPTSDPAGSVPPADLTSACEGSYAPTSDQGEEHVNETNAGDRAEEGDVPRVVSGATVGLFGGKWAAVVAPEPTPEPKPAPVETVKERNRRERAERAAALAAEVNTVWQAYAARHPHAGRRGPDGERLPSEADAHRIAGAVTEWGAADVLLLLDWAHDAPDDQATWLQGKRSGTAYLGLANLLVADKASGRLDIARQWHAHGRPLTMPEGPRVNGRHIRSIADDLRELQEWEDSQRGSREVIDVH